jgi:hypothetical protein
MKTIALKNGMVIFVEQIAFIHVQASSAKDGPVNPEIHVHFSAGLSTPNGARSMRAVVKQDNSQDFLGQLDKHGVDCTHLRRCISELGKPPASPGKSP